MAGEQPDQVETAVAVRAAQILSFPLQRHVAMDRLARTLAGMAKRKANATLKKDIIGLIQRRIRRGVPEDQAIRDGFAFQQAVQARMAEIKQEKRT